MNKREPKNINPKTLPTPHPSKEVQNRVRVINTIQINPSLQIGYKVSFKPLGGGNLILEHQPISSAPKSPKQAQRCCHPNFLRFLPTTASCQAKRV